MSRKRNPFMIAGPSRPALAIWLALAAAGMQAPAHAVQPPPLPPGSAMVRIQGGMDENEVKRHVRAHRHKSLHKKDYTRDDSVDDGRRGAAGGPGASFYGNARDDEDKGSKGKPVDPGRKP